MYSKISFNANMIDNRHVTIERGFFSLSLIIDVSTLRIGYENIYNIKSIKFNIIVNL